jgi:antitoxin component YwqK of YwqJK toxin-antitoxin module
MTKFVESKISVARNGKWKEFNKHAVLVAEGQYVNNKKHGTWREYYDHTGTIMIEENYKLGIKHGTFTSYHPDGQIFGQGEFFNGLREGYFRIYDEQRDNVRTLLFINNNQVEDITKRVCSDKIEGGKNGS